MARVKGVALINRIKLLKENFGEDAYYEVMCEIPEEQKEQLNNLLFSSWYDATLFRDMNIGIRKALGKKHANISEKIGELTADASLKGIYSSKLKEGKPELTMQRAASLYRTLHDGGELELATLEEGKVVLRVKGYPLPHREFCKTLMGWGRRLVELSGGKSVRVKENQCVCNGDPVCEMTVTWE